MKKLENVADIYPLTPIQLGMLYHTLREPDSHHYFEQVRCDVVGDLQIDCFRGAWETIVKRHPALRTIFLWEGVEQPLQVVREEVDLPWEVIDWRAKAPGDQAADLDELAETQRLHGFDLKRAPILNLTLIRLADDRSHLIWNFHHMILDGWSSAIILNELLETYTSLTAGQRLDAPPVRPFRNYLGWLKKQDHAAAKTFWEETVGDITVPTPLQVDRKIGQNRFELGRQQVTLSAATTQKLKAFAQRNRLTMNTVVQGVWGVLLSRYSGQDDVTFGVTISGRPADLPQVEEMVGMFLNTLPLRLDLSKDGSLTTWLQQVQGRQLEINQFQFSSLADIQRWSGVPAGQPLFESLLIFENYPTAPTDPQRVVQLANKTVREQTNYPLTLMVGVEDHLELQALYNRHRLTDDVMNRLLGHAVHLFEQVAADPGQTLHGLELLSPSEKHEMLVEWNQTEAPYPDNTTIPALFAAQAAATPNKTALIFDNREMSYRELDRRSNQLAYALRDAGVGPEIPVGIALYRSFDMMVALLATVKAGGAYVPLDPNYPPERLKIIMEDVAMPVILSDTAVQTDFPAVDFPIISLDLFPYDTYSDAPLPITIDPDSTLFITFTSGSTGRPKGVQGHHRGVLNRCQWQWDHYPLGENEICCHKTTLNFVDHLWEIWGPLLNGTPAVLIPDEVIKDANRFLTLLADYAIERIVLVPSFIRVLLDSYPDLAARLPSLKYWTLSGESLSRALADLFRERMPHALILNVYGMSEVTADATWYDDRWGIDCDTIPIGKPLNNFKVYVLDNHHRPVPTGVPGEIYVSGIGLSRGYWGRDDLTAERFFSNPFDDNPDSRLYKSGDLGRWLPEGQVEYIGRADHQVKIRGFRVEPGEIEAALGTHPAVNDVVVVPQTYGIDKRLIAYVIAKSEVSDEVLRRLAREQLPDYMVPAAIIFLDAFPMTPNGKINRRGLAKPEISRAPAVAEERTVIQAKMIALWEELIGISGIELDDDFFDIGGHSLLALRLFSRFKKEFDVNLPLATLVDAPTPRLLSALLDPAAVEAPQIEKNWHHLVPFDSAGDDVGNIFCVHGAGGNVLNFHPLAQTLQPDWRLIGIQASGVDGESPILETMDGICNSYLAEIQAFQPRGPYVLAGFSSGGVIAYEMAQRLKAAGKEVAAVVFFDTFHPSVRARRRRVTDHLSELLTSGPAYVAELVQDRSDKRASEQDAVEKALKIKMSGAVVPFELRNALMVHFITQVMKNYQPRPYDGLVVQFTAEEAWWMFDHVPHHRGWAGLVSELEVKLTGGNHDSLVLEPHVADLAAKLRQQLSTKSAVPAAGAD